MDKFFNYLFGISSFLGFLWTCFNVNNTLRKFNALAENESILKDIPHIISSLSWSLVALIVFFIFLIMFTSRKLSQANEQMGKLPIENAILKEQLNRSILNKKTLCANTHNILHEYRYVILNFDKVLHNPSDTKKEEIEEALDIFDGFIRGLLSNISDFFKSFTGDRCASCIKIVKDGKVKTFSRDPLCQRARKRSDYNQDGTPYIYKVTENYAFNIITDSKSKSRTFFYDNLLEFKGYHNDNPDWSKLYNSCGVVPISKRIKKQWRRNEWNVIGFLCVDNIKGGLESKEAEDFLCAFGDLLYALLLKYDNLAAISQEKGITNERLQTYTNWDEG